VAGASVEWARDGREGVQCALAEPFGLLLADVQMPVMDGLEATRRLRAEPLPAGLLIVGMTARAMAGDHMLCRAAGMDDVLVKPFNPDELFGVVARWLPLAAATPVPGGSAMDQPADHRSR
jgi:two-component system sensor histidine kinase/response regulator